MGASDLGSEWLLRELEALDLAFRERRYACAYSGGLDSTVLVDLLRGLPVPGSGLRLMHVDHGLHAESQKWSEHCKREAREWGLALTTLTVSVDSDGGPEAAARAARYRALASILEAGETLVTAQHQDDQLETLLLQLLRGAGPAGLAGMPGLAAFAGGSLMRPLLNATRAQIEKYARAHGLRWLTDPSNADTGLGRNYLRLKVIPAIRDRWPAAAAMGARSAALCAATADLADELAELDLAGGQSGGALDYAPLATLTRPRRANALRRFIRRSGFTAPNLVRLDNFLCQLEDQPVTGRAELVWPAGTLNLYAGRLFLDRPRVPPPDDFDAPLTPEAPLTLPAGLGQLALIPDRGAGIRRTAGRDGRLHVVFRHGGEAIRLQAGGPRRALKKLFNETRVFPWVRARIPLIACDGALAAVGDWWLDADFAAGPGDPSYRVEWDRPPGPLRIEDETPEDRLEP